MILIGLLFLCAIALSAIAGVFSIAGLMAIFAAAPIPIAIAGTTLELSKLVVASWLYRNWAQIPLMLKGYLSFALVVLMLLTSMGIFGYLSKAHLDQGVPTGDVAAKVALIDEKIQTEKDNITAARRALAQLDEQVNQTLSRTAAQSNDAGVNRSVAIRRAQTKERNQLTAEIEKAQATISTLNDQRAPIAAELRKVEAEVGPIKYIAQLIYGHQDAQNATALEKAVQWVTVLIVTVFDPLAVILLIAANWSMINRKYVPPLTDVMEPSTQPATDSTIDPEPTPTAVHQLDSSTEHAILPEQPSSIEIDPARSSFEPTVDFPTIVDHISSSQPPSELDQPQEHVDHLGHMCDRYWEASNRSSIPTS